MEERNWMVLPEKYNTSAIVMLYIDAPEDLSRQGITKPMSEIDWIAEHDIPHRYAVVLVYTNEKDKKLYEIVHSVYDRLSDACETATKIKLP